MLTLAITLRLTRETVSELEALLPTISTLYSAVSIVAAPTDNQTLIDQVRSHHKIFLQVGQKRVENRRYLTLKQALAIDSASHIHYCDGDHLLTRLRPHLEDWKRTLAHIVQTDCLIIGRTPEVFESYPSALRETEKTINLVASYLLGQPVDLGAGARGFSRAAAQYLIQHAHYETHAVATDAEWPVLLHHAGFHIATYASQGALYHIWNDSQRQRLVSVEQWTKRTQLAHLIIEAGIHAAQRDNLPSVNVS